MPERERDAAESLGRKARPMARKPLKLQTLRPRRVAIVKPSSLGDVVHATPVLAALRDRWPDAHFGWIINKGLIDLVRGLPGLDEAIPFDRAGARVSPGGVATVARFVAGLRRKRFDLAIDLQGLLRSGLITRATGAPVRVGFEDAREGASRFYTHRVAFTGERLHAVDRLLGVARAFGCPSLSARFLSAISDAERAEAEQTLAAVARPRLIWNVGARWVTKRWPPERFAAVARLAAERLGAGSVIVGAPEDRPLVDRFQDEMGDRPALDLCGRTSLPRLAALAAASDLFVSNDSGPLHLAVAAGARVLGVYTCTKPDWTGPYGPRAEVVRSEIWCAGSCVKTCPRLECFTELSPDRVYDAVARAISSRSGESAA